MVKLTWVPWHTGVVDSVFGVTVIVAVTGLVPEFVAANALIVPVPEAPRPIEGFELVHAKVVPGTLPERFT